MTNKSGAGPKRVFEEDGKGPLSASDSLRRVIDAKLSKFNEGSSDTILGPDSAVPLMPVSTLNYILDDVVRQAEVDRMKSIAFEILQRKQAADASELEDMYNRIDYLDQCSAESEAVRITGHLGFTCSPTDAISKVAAVPSTSTPTSDLMPPWTRRAALAKALVKRPTLLLVDAVDSYLDPSSLGWLAGELKDYDGAVVVASTNPLFLAHVCTDMLLIEEPGQITTFSGPFQDFKKNKTDEELAQWNLRMHLPAGFFQVDAIKAKPTSTKATVSQATILERSYTPFMVAIMEGHMKLVNHLLAQGLLACDIDAEDWNGWRAFTWVIKTFPTSVALLERMIMLNVNFSYAHKSGNNPLFEAAYVGNEAAVLLLVAQGMVVKARNNNEETPVMLAAQAGRVNMVRLFAQLRADLRALNILGDDLLFLAIRNRVKVETLIELLDVMNNPPKPPAHHLPPASAAATSSSARAQPHKAWNQGAGGSAPPPAQPSTAQAKKKGQPKKTTALPPYDMFRTNLEGNTLLMVAAEAVGAAYAMNWLIEMGLNVDAVNKDGYNALMIAAKYSRLDATLNLLSYNCELNTIAKDGHNAWSLAKEKLDRDNAENRPPEQKKINDAVIEALESAGIRKVQRDAVLAADYAAQGDDEPGLAAEQDESIGAQVGASTASASASVAASSVTAPQSSMNMKAPAAQATKKAPVDYIERNKVLAAKTALRSRKSVGGDLSEVFENPKADAAAAGAASTSMTSGSSASDGPTNRSRAARIATQGVQYAAGTSKRTAEPAVAGFYKYGPQMEGESDMNAAVGLPMDDDWREAEAAEAAVDAKAVHEKIPSQMTAAVQASTQAGREKRAQVQERSKKISAPVEHSFKPTTNLKPSASKPSASTATATATTSKVSAALPSDDAHTAVDPAEGAGGANVDAGGILAAELPPGPVPPPPPAVSAAPAAPAPPATPAAPAAPATGAPQRSTRGAGGGRSATASAVKATPARSASTAPAAGASVGGKRGAPAQAGAPDAAPAAKKRK